MKKFFSMIAMVLVMATTANAQFVNSGSKTGGTSSFNVGDCSNYSRIYGGFTLLSGGDASETLKGATLGYTYALNVTGQKLPLFLEVGGEVNWITYDMGKESGNKLNVAVPVNLVYKFECNESISLMPFTGPNFRVNILDKAGDYDSFDTGYSDFDATRFQFGWNFGLGVTFNQFYLGYRFTVDFNEYVKGAKSCKYNSFCVGYQF